MRSRAVLWKGQSWDEGVLVSEGGISSQPFGRVTLDQGQEPRRRDSIHSESGYLLGVLVHGLCVQE